ncbi:MAG: universal stress protein [Chloroflexi bacterium]|nr:universal stress protein [Chloroflexota bacterium]
MYERILVPLDGSKLGEAALPYIEELVSRLLPGTKVEVTLLQVLSLLTHWVVAGEAGVSVPYTEQEMKRFKQQAADYLGKAGEGLSSKGATVKIRVGVGNAAEEIITAAHEINADIIAMSSHGRSGFSRWAFGSVTDRVLRGGDKPVLVIKATKGVKTT